MSPRQAPFCANVTLARLECPKLTFAAAEWELR